MVQPKVTPAVRASCSYASTSGEPTPSTSGCRTTPLLAPKGRRTSTIRRRPYYFNARWVYRKYKYTNPFRALGFYLKRNTNAPFRAHVEERTFYVGEDKGTSPQIMNVEGIRPNWEVHRLGYCCGIVRKFKPKEEPVEPEMEEEEEKYYQPPKMSFQNIAAFSSQKDSTPSDQNMAT